MVYAPHALAIDAAYRSGGLVDAVITDNDGQIVVTWPNGRGTCLASPEIIEGWAEQINQLRAEVAALRDRLGA